MIDVFFKGKQLLTSSDTFSGGVNLFRNTDKLDKFWMSFTDNQGQADSSANYASDVNHELIATKSLFHIWGSKANQTGLKSTQEIYCEQGVYTISFLARNNGTESPSFNLSLYSDYTDSHGGAPLGSTRANLTNVWQQYSITFRIDQAGTYGGWRLINWSDAQVPGGSLFFANLKLEHGPVATDWCPALEDYAMKSDLDVLKAENDNSINFRKKIIGGTVDIAHDCNKTGYYWVDAVQKDPIPPYKENQTSVRCIIHTIAYDYNGTAFRYQEIIFDGGKYYRGSWQGDDGYSPWLTEASISLNLDSLASRVSALEKQIGGK